MDGSETYLVRHISAGREELQSEKYGSYVNVGIHISFDRRPPQDLLDGASLNIGGTVLEFGDASTAMDNDREWYFGWYTALAGLCTEASTVSIWFCRVDMLELTARILGGKPPVYG